MKEWEMFLGNLVWYKTKFIQIIKKIKIQTDCTIMVLFWLICYSNQSCDQLISLDNDKNGMEVKHPRKPAFSTVTGFSI